MGATFSKSRKIHDPTPPLLLGAFTRLPPKIPCQVWSYLLSDNFRVLPAPRNYFFAVLFGGARKQLGILRAGRHLYDEISPILYDQDLDFFANELECTFEVQTFGLGTMRSVI